nr:isoaspartyl peptidase-like [Nerophis lumbriciformis]
MAVISCTSVEQKRAPIALAIHGGAGTILPENLNPQLEAQITSKLTEAVRAGHEILEAGGSSLDAVQTAVMILEDSPLFNAGKGAVFNAEGENELDAAIMSGADLNAGAVASLRRVKNPILAARRVMEDSPHVLLAGQGAEVFAQAQGLQLVDPSYFHTQKRREQLDKAKARARQKFGLSLRSINLPHDSDEWYSTVGAVALDRQGNLAAGTSTGGLTNKKWGRVGDVPIIGAGTYANNETCAVSATGHGEYFIRSVVAYDICALMDYQNKTLAEATDAVVMNKLVARGGNGGVIAIDGQGKVSLRFNTAGMYRAAIDADGRLTVGIYR